MKLIYAILAALASWSKPRRVHFVNDITVGRHDTGNITKSADAAIATKYLLGKVGDDANSIAACGASEIPLGVITDEAEAADDLVNVAILGNAQGTLLMIASEAISQGEHVYTAASGKVQDYPTGVAGTYYCVGLALTAATADGDQIEVAHCVPIATVVT